MKRLTRYLAFVAIPATLCWGCASSDSNTGVVAVTGSGATQAETSVSDPTPQAPMDTDTEMSSESIGDNNVSASNEIGRSMNIVALVQQNPNLSTFLELVRAANMVTVLESPAPYTVFAPTNAAFAALPDGTVDALKQEGNQLELRRILQAHVLPNRISAAEMQDNMPLKTAQGEELLVRRSGGDLTVGGSQIILPDVEASNGVVHVVNKVLVPPKSNSR